MMGVSRFTSARWALRVDLNSATGTERDSECTGCRVVIAYRDFPVQYIRPRRMPAAIEAIAQDTASKGLLASAA